MNIKQMLYTLKKRPHIVEQGESGGWTYRKWSDGTAECWGTHTKRITINTIATYYHRGYITNIAYPTGLFISAPSVFAQVNNTSMWAGLETNSKTEIQILYVYSVADDTRDIDIAIYAVGKRK